MNKMKNNYAKFVGIFLIALFVSVSLSSLSAFREFNNTAPVEFLKAKKYTPNIFSVKSEDSVNLIVKDSTINGSVYLSNKTNALFDNVSILSNTMIVLEEDAKLVIKNSYWESEVYILLRDYSGLIIDDMQNTGTMIDISVVGHAGLYISANITNSYIVLSGSASAWIDECHIEDSTIELENSSTIDITNVNITSGNIYARHFATIYSQNINDTYNDLDIRLFDFSKFNGSYAHLNATQITLNDYASIELYESELCALYEYNSSSASLRNIEASNIYVFDDAYCFVADSTATNIFLDIIGESYEPKINIVRSEITYLYLKSFAINNITNSHVSTLEYLTIHTGTLYVNSSSTISDSSYVNYHLQDSTIDTTTELPITAAKNSPYVEYNISNGQLILANVPSAEILDVEYLYAYDSYGVVRSSSAGDLWVYSYRSEVVLDSFGLDFAQIHSSDSNIKFVNMSVTGIDISSYHSEISLSNETSLDSPMIKLYSTNMSIIESEVLSVGSLLLNESLMFLNNSVLTNGSTTTYQAYHSLIKFQNSNVSIVLYGDTYLEFGEYVMNNCAVINANIRYGAVDLGGNNLTNFEFYGNILLVNATLNYTGKKMGLDYNINFTLMNNSKLSIDGLEAGYVFIYVRDVGILDITNTSVISSMLATQLRISMVDSNVEYLEAIEIHGAINSTVINNAEVLLGDLLLTDTNITEQLMFREGSLSIIGGNISSLQLGSLDTPDLTMLYTTITLVENADVGVLSSLSRGELNISGSTVDRVMSVVSRVNVVASTIDTISRGYLITASGTVEINGNSIPPGTYEELLTVIGSSINYYADVIVADMNTELSLIIRDSEYFGVFASCNSVNIENTNLSNMFIQANETDIRGVNVDSSFMEEAPPVFLAGSTRNNIIIRGLNISGAMLILSNANVSAEDIVADALMVMDSNGQINTTFFSSYDANVSLYLSSVSFYDLRTSDMGVLTLYQSKANIFGTNISGMQAIESNLVVSDDPQLELILATKSNVSLINVNMIPALEAYFYGIVVDNGSTISIDTSNITNIIPMFSYSASYMLAGPLEYLVSPFLTKIMASNSKISRSYVEYLVHNMHDDLIYEPPYPERTYLTTQYTATEVYTVDSAIINVMGLSHLNITGFRNVEISYLYAMFEVSPTVPTIELYNDTNIIYEFGLEAKLAFAISDDNPSTYNLTIGDIYTTVEEYTSGELIVYTLSEIIEEPGNYIYTIIATDTSGNEYSVQGNITVFPAEPPVIFSSPEDTTINVGEHIVLRWSASDNSPYMYKILINGSIVEEKSWSGGTAEYNFTASDPGTYNVSIMFIDKLGLEANSSVIIRVREESRGGGIPATTFYMIMGVIAVSAIALIVLVVFRKRR